MMQGGQQDNNSRAQLDNDQDQRQRLDNDLDEED